MTDAQFPSYAVATEVQSCNNKGMQKGVGQNKCVVRGARGICAACANSQLQSTGRQSEPSVRQTHSALCDAFRCHNELFVFRTSRFPAKPFSHWMFIFLLVVTRKQCASVLTVVCYCDNLCCFYSVCAQVGNPRIYCFSSPHRVR